MSGKGIIKKIAIALTSVMLAVISTYSFADLLQSPTGTTTTTTTSLVPLVPPKPAGSAASIRVPPMSTTGTTSATSGTTISIPQRNPRIGPEGKTIVDARYDLDLPVCPANNNLCPDINNKCSNPGGGCRDMKLPVSNVANYNKCPETCRVSRTTTGWNTIRNAPDSSVEAVCPSGYSTLAAYNLGPEYKTSVGTAEIQLPWPLTGASATQYRYYFYDTNNFRCGVYGNYSTTTCQSGTTVSNRNATPLNSTLGDTYPTYWGYVSASLDYGYTNYGADQSWGPAVDGTCYKDNSCSALDTIPITWCNSPYGGNPSGCNAYSYGYGWYCLYGTAVNMGCDPWGNCTWYCSQCTGSSYHYVTRMVYPNICWYRGGKLIPGAGQIPTSLVCGRIKPTWQ